MVNFINVNFFVSRDRLITDLTNTKAGMTDGQTDGPMDKQTDGWTDGGMDRLTDGWIVGQMD